MTPDEINDKYRTGDYKLKGEFQSGHYAREETLRRCERYAGWTLPGVFPDDPLNEYDELQYDYQSFGAQAVINLSNKLVMAMFPPSRPFFRLTLSKEQRAEIQESQGWTDSQIDEALATAEREATEALVSKDARAHLTELAKLIIITGNGLVQMPKGKNLRSHTLRNYTIQRDASGIVTKIVLRESVSVVTLSKEMRDLAEINGYNKDVENVCIYTAACRLDDGRFALWQELEDVCYCQKQIGIVKEDDLEFIPVVWELATSKNYGTGLVESYSGDFHSLSTFAEAVLDYTTIMTDIKVLVNPTGTTDVRALQQSAPGAFVQGREEDIAYIQADVRNQADFLTAQIEQRERRLAAAFLMNTMVTRDAERVTAEEIRRQALELEQSLGGVYSRLAVSLQLPIATRLIREIDVGLGDAKPVITTGLDALSRGGDLERLRAFFADLVALADVPEEVARRINYDAIISELGANHGVEYKKFLKDDDTVRQDTKEQVDTMVEVEGRVEAAKSQGKSAGK